MPRKNKNLIDIVTPGSSEITSRKKSNKKRLSRKQKSQQLKEKIREDFIKNNVGVDSGYTNADIEAITEMRTLSEQKNGKETYLNQFYDETASHNKDYNYLGKKINEDYSGMRTLDKDIDGKSSLKQGFISYDEFKNLDMGDYNEMGDANTDPKDVFFESYKRRGSNIESENKNLMLRKQGYEELTNKDFKEIFGKSKREDKKTFNEDLQSAKEKYSTGVFGLGGIKSKSYIVGEENAKPFLDKYNNIKKEAQNIDSRFKFSNEKFNKLTGAKKSKLKFG
tara:strand:+ start:2885 stop:3724 length:840 start_codon:yes stop_codon:yes gene_type:complete